MASAIHRNRTCENLPLNHSNLVWDHIGTQWISCSIKQMRQRHRQKKEEEDEIVGRWVQAHTAYQHHDDDFFSFVSFFCSFIIAVVVYTIPDFLLLFFFWMPIANHQIALFQKYHHRGVVLRYFTTVAAIHSQHIAVDQIYPIYWIPFKFNDCTSSSTHPLCCTCLCEWSVMESKTMLSTQQTTTTTNERRKK